MKTNLRGKYHLVFVQWKDLSPGPSVGKVLVLSVQILDKIKIKQPHLGTSELDSIIQLKEGKRKKSRTWKEESPPGCNHERILLHFINPSKEGTENTLCSHYIHQRKNCSCLLYKASTFGSNSTFQNELFTLHEAKKNNPPCKYHQRLHAGLKGQLCIKMGTEIQPPFVSKSIFLPLPRHWHTSQKYSELLREKAQS